VNVFLAMVLDILIYVIRIYTFVLLASAILRLVRADETNGIVRVVHALADPPARAITRKFPKLVVRSGHQIIDLGPILLLVGLGCVIIALGHLKNAL
jgi:uncharacterized protein YggT (Ycf19 family)